MDPELDRYLKGQQTLVEAALDRLVPAATRPPPRLHQAMRHSLMAGGKRLRPILVLAACEAVGGDPVRALPFACALECIHTYSLIHDDLPAMDDDDLRRGRPTCHKAFDEATAILAGDGLLTLAFDLIASHPEGHDPALLLELVGQLARDAGVFGMVGGQMFDLLAEQQEVNLAELQNIHIHKTAALIRCACVAGARLGGGAPEQVKALNRYGETLGLAFQIMDDVLDEVGNSDEMGKSAGSDQRKAKATYTRLLGLPQARQEAAYLMEEGVRAIDGFAEAAAPLRWLARYVVTRTR